MKGTRVFSIEPCAVFGQDNTNQDAKFTDGGSVAKNMRTSHFGDWKYIFYIYKKIQPTTCG